MHVEVVTAGDGLLVIGYGNTLRADDGAGVRVAEAVASWDRPGLASLAVQQLTPELADALAGAGRVVFVDARLDAEESGMAVEPLEPSADWRPASHVGDPRSLLALARWLHGRSPQAWLITIPAVDFSIGERISPTAARGIDRALDRIARMAADLPVSSVVETRTLPPPPGPDGCAQGRDDSGCDGTPRL